MDAKSSNAAAPKGANASRSPASATADPARRGRRTFPRDARLLSRREFAHVYRQGRSVRHPSVVLYHLASARGPDAATRFGFTVSRRVARRATARNRIRRVWREAARLSRPRFRGGLDIVLNARAAAGCDLRTPEAQAILLELADRQGLLLPGS